LGGKKVKRLANFSAAVALLGATVDATAGMDANTLLHAYDTGTPKEKIAIEQIVLTAENALREASSVIVLQRNELGLYCPPRKDLPAQTLIEMIRHEVSGTDFIGKYPFETSLLHALQVTFPCPAQ
jgi:hypothetical protein